jgi:hypothetical protein
MVYSEDTGGGTEKIGIVKTTRITEQGQKVDLGDIYIAKD